MAHSGASLDSSFPVATFDSICFSALQRIPICPINITDTKIVNGSGY